MSKGKKHDVICLRDVSGSAVGRLLRQMGLEFERVPSGEDIPGSYWGDEEAGLVGKRLYARGDTPVHSILHEACHFACMDDARRAKLDTDAGGDYDEENAVCYLQILLAERIPGFGGARCMSDMDTWGYTFRLGSAKKWFEKDAQDAKAWLEARDLLKLADEPEPEEGAEPSA